MPRPRRDPSTILKHFRDAQRVAMSPLTFQAAWAAREMGVLDTLHDAPQGLTPREVAARSKVSLYTARILLEACLIVDLVELSGGRYQLAPAGIILLTDPVARINMDFVQDVCYQGAFHLKESLEQGKPAGLKVFGDWATIYEGLTKLPAKAQKSWFDFDHSYSSAVFPQALPVVFSQPTGKLLDVGGNTGKWALACVAHDAQVRLTLLDHPGQLELARKNLAASAGSSRVSYVPMDLLDHRAAFPAGQDAVWMSQFLDCFQEEDITELLKRGRAALAPGGRLYILETLWDRQPHLPARDAVIASSVYFACMANGHSRMYHSEDLRGCVQAAGLELAEDHQLGLHSLWVCRPSLA